MQWWEDTHHGHCLLSWCTHFDVLGANIVCGGVYLPAIYCWLPHCVDDVMYIYIRSVCCHVDAATALTSLASGILYGLTRRIG